MRTVQRGIAVYNALLFDDQPSTTHTTEKANGRNPELIAARDNYLLHRLYFKTKLQRLNYLDAVQEIADETWLSTLQVQKIIQSKADDVLKIKHDKTSVQDMRKKWPHIQW